MSFTPTSGYISIASHHINSLAGWWSENGAFLVQQWFLPIPPKGEIYAAGTVTHMGFVLWKQGAPTGVRTIGIWESASGHNHWFYGQPNAGVNNYVLRSIVRIDAASVQVGSINNCSWYLFQVDTPFWCEMLPPPDGTNEQAPGKHYWYWGTTSPAPGSSTNRLNFAILEAPRHGALPGGSDDNAISNQSVFGTDVQFTLVGLVQSSSKWQDAPMGYFAQAYGHNTGLNTSSFVLNDDVGGDVQLRKAILITAVGSKITRMIGQFVSDGVTSASMWGSIWTHNANSMQPETCIGSGTRMIFQNSAQGPITSDAAGRVFDVITVFSGGINITSGTQYWVAWDASSFNSSALVWLRIPRFFTNVDSHVLISWRSDIAANSFFSAVSKQTNAFEIFYADSATANGFSGGGGGGPGPAVAGPGFRRGYPVPSPRQYPAALLREIPHF